MSFVDCIQNAINNGNVRPEKGQEAIDAYNRTVADMKAKGMSEMAAADAASIEATKKVTTAKSEGRWARLQEMRAAYRLTQALDTKGMKPWEVATALIEGDHRSPHANIHTRSDRIRGLLHAQMEAGLAKYEPRLAGMHRPMSGMDNLVRESFGESTGDASAKEIATELATVAETARQRANAAGASIPKLESWRLPQRQDRLKVRKGTEAVWSRQHMDWLDWDAMKHPDGSDILEAERPQVLSSIYNTLLTDGYVKIRPGQNVPDKLSSRLSSQRFMRYKDADSWLAANKAYGDGDAFSQMISYVDSMSRDIALMEVLGPNPTAMKKFIEQSVRKKAADMDVAKGAAKGKSNTAKADEALASFGDMYDVLTSANAMGEESGLGHTFAGIRNVLSSSLLGSATIAAVPGDFSTMKLTALYNKLPVTGHLRQYLKLLNPASDADRRMAVRSGLIAESATSVSLGSQRFFGEMSGSQLSRRISDTTMRLTLMTPHTQAARWAFGMETMGAFADASKKSFDSLPFKDMFERHGITAEDWDVFRATPTYNHKGASFLRPDDVLSRTDLSSRQANEVADRFMDMILSERQYAVIESSIKGRAMLMATTRGGTVSGEMLRGVAMFKNFPVTILMLHAQRAMYQSTYAGKAAYGAAFFGTLTLGGALATQANEVASGRDPLDMTSPKFWGKAVMKGGGLGYFGDLAFSNVNRHGQGLQDMLIGPVGQFATEARNLTIGNAAELMAGKETHAAREAAAFAARYNPLSSMWYTKLAFRRRLADQLQVWADPTAHQRFREMERKNLQEYDQKYWWSPGDTGPSRAPSIRAAAGGGRY